MNISVTMKCRIFIQMILAMFSLTLFGCVDEPDPYIGNRMCIPADSSEMDWRDTVFNDSPLRQRHRDSRLKILAIGNSFTNNATFYMPWLIDRLDADSICVAKLTRSGCSLGMHWTSHVRDSQDYEMQYSDGGVWVKEEIATIDAALSVLDWDIITIQQVSGHSGLYDTYQPYLDYLVRLFHETAPVAQIAWHSTWAYREGCEHQDFRFYDYDPKIMYDAIIETSGKLAGSVDIMIPATDLIWRMREAYPEVDDQFSSDGFHITDSRARYALSVLWYEILLSPYTGRHALDVKDFPDGIKTAFMQRALSIITEITDRSNSDDTEVGMIFAD